MKLHFNLKIRKARWEDYTFCYKLTHNNMLYYMRKHWGGWKPESFRKHFNPKKTYICIHKDRRIAFFCIRKDSDVMYIEQMQVSKIMQGKGIGTYLMKLIEGKTLRSKRKKIQLKVFKKNPAKKLYSRLGYKIKKDDDSSVIMGKKLN